MRRTERIARSLGSIWTFFLMGYRLALSYPMAFVMNQLAIVLPVFTFYFVAKLLPDVAHAIPGGDYFTFVVLGVVATNVLMAGLQAFGRELDDAVQQGRFEVLLTEPVGWRLLAIGLAVWPILWRLATSAIVLLAAIPLGARYRWAGIGWAILLLILGATAGLSIGVLSGAVRVLAKRSDPILALYTLAGSVLGGVFFPIELLPAWLRWTSYLIPQTYVASGLRAALAPASTTGDSGATETLAILTLFTLFVLPVGLWAFGRSLDFGRRVGVLGGY